MGVQNINEFAKDVIYTLRSKEGRNRFIYDDGAAHLTEEQQTVIKELKDSGEFDQAQFDQALIAANHSYADDLVEGCLEVSNLPEGERELLSLLNTIRETGNEDLIDSAKEFVRLTLNNEICSSGLHGSLSGDNTQYAVMTNASWVGLLPNAYNALSQAMRGEFDGRTNSHTGLNYFINERGVYDDHGRALKTAAKALRADIKEHLESTSNDLDTQNKSGLSAAAQAARFDGPS